MYRRALLGQDSGPLTFLQTPAAGYQQPTPINGSSSSSPWPSPYLTDIVVPGLEPLTSLTPTAAAEAPLMSRMFSGTLLGFPMWLWWLVGGLIVVGVYRERKQ